MARTPPSRVSGRRILADLRLASRKGDRSALTLALDQMRTLAHSPRYWESTSSCSATRWPVWSISS